MHLAGATTTWRDRLEAEIALDLLPQAGLPAVDVELIGIKGCDWHRRVRADYLIRRYIFRAQIKPPGFLLARVGKPINGKTQIRQYIVIDDIVQEHGVRIERVLGQNDAIIKGFVVTYGRVLASDSRITVHIGAAACCEPTHNFR